METQTVKSLKEQLLERMAQIRTASAAERQKVGPFGTGESREDYERRIMEDESAWTCLGNQVRSILPR